MGITFAGLIESRRKVVETRARKHYLERMSRIDGHQKDELPARLRDLAERLRPSYDTRPVGRAEWDAACGDETPAVAPGQTP
jgi:hypothetical protein